MSTSPIITLLTDFGDCGGYVAQVKAAILAICRHAVLVDIAHSIPPQDVASAAWLLRDVVETFPPDTIHVVVVDPGVGSDRRILAMQSAVGRFVAPDCGVLTLVAKDFCPMTLVELKERKYWRPEISSTFHGRDIMGPVAGHLAAGVSLSAFGPARPEMLLLPLPEVVVQDYEMDGTIVRIDSFGNLITNITVQDLTRVTDARRLNWECRGHHACAFVDTYSNAATGELVVLLGSSGRLEFSVVQGNAADTLQARVGDVVRGRPIHVF